MPRAFFGSFRFIGAFLGLAGVLGASCAAAEPPGDHELKSAYVAARAAWIPGPGSVKLIDQAVLVLAPEDGFVPKAEAERLMRALGNATDPGLIGLVLPRNDIGRWFVAVSFQKMGFVSPEVLSRLNKDDIYDHMRRAAHRGNGRREKEGSAKIDLGDFIEPPRYEPKFDRLAMAAHVIQHSQGDGAQDSARLDAYLFGRDGVLGLSLTAHPGGYANLHHHVDQLVSGASFLPGKRYADAVASDKRSDYPLEMLFGGQTIEEAATDKAAATARLRQNALLEQQHEQADREWQLYLVAGAASLLLSSMAVFVFHRATAA